jgi:DNA repair protein RecO (recombination protein O)
MRDKLELTGMVLSSMPVGDYDKRLVILTKERGKITAFARGARKPNSPYLGISEPFNFGCFTVLEGYDAYRLVGASVREYFLEVKNDIAGVCYGTYFCDVLEYLCMEGMGDMHILNLLYVTLKALTKPGLEKPLVRRIFELKLLALEGEAMAAFSCTCCGSTEKLNTFCLTEDGLVCADCGKKKAAGIGLTESAVYTLQYILSSPLEKLYSFRVTPEVFAQLDRVIDLYFHRHVTRNFKSLEILSSLS